jgi:hypothetical protein
MLGVRGLEGRAAQRRNFKVSDKPYYVPKADWNEGSHLPIETAPAPQPTHRTLEQKAQDPVSEFEKGFAPPSEGDAGHEQLFTELFKDYSGREAKGFRHALRRNLEPLLAAHDAAVRAATEVDQPSAEEIAAAIHNALGQQFGKRWARYSGPQTQRLIIETINALRVAPIERPAEGGE